MMIVKYCRRGGGSYVTDRWKRNKGHIRRRKRDTKGRWKGERGYDDKKGRQAREGKGKGTKKSKRRKGRVSNETKK